MIRFCHVTSGFKRPASVLHKAPVHSLELSISGCVVSDNSGVKGHRVAVWVLGVVFSMIKVFCYTVLLSHSECINPLENVSILQLGVYFLLWLCICVLRVFSWKQHEETDQQPGRKANWLCLWNVGLLFAAFFSSETLSRITRLHEIIVCFLSSVLLCNLNLLT